MHCHNWLLPTILFVSISFLIGCAEGPLWQTGRYVPWVRAKWEAEEQLADTIFERKRELNNLVDAASTAGSLEQSRAATNLASILEREPVLLVRLHTIQLLGKLPCAEAVNALKLASKDPDSRVRLAAVRSLQSQPVELAMGPLKEVLGSDTNVDVRLATTKALGETNNAAATQALSLALTDSNPAVQLRATEALAKITGQNIGPDVAAWQEFLDTNSRQTVAGSQPENRIR